MSKADVMFKKLGYEKRKGNCNCLYDIKYYKDDYNVYYFYFVSKRFEKSGEHDGMSDKITMQELQAINEKVKELRMGMNKKLEEAIKQYIEHGQFNLGEEDRQAIDAILQALDNSISKEKVRSKIIKYQNAMKEDKTYFNIFNANNIRQEVITNLQELLEEK